MLLKERANEIEDIADFVAHSYYRSQHFPVPTELKEIVQCAGLELRVARFEDRDVAGTFTRDTRTIRISEFDIHYPRGNFTIAHETGHYYLHPDAPHDILYRRDIESNNKGLPLIEKEANRFAAALLMPQRCLELLANGSDIIYAELNDLANMFCVSRTAMSIRMRDLGYSLGEKG